MIIDFHVHCFSDNIAKNAVSQLEKAAGIKAYSDGTAAGLKRIMKNNGIDMSVAMPVATKPSQVGSINSWAKQTADEQLVFFGAVHPDSEDVPQVLSELKQSGFKGIKLHPDYQGFFADEERIMPLYEAACDLGLIVVLHAGVDIGLPGAVHCTPLMISNVIRNFPGIKLVAAHMGSHALWRDAEEVLVGKQLFLDTSYSAYELKSEGMMRMINNHGADNILFGSDSPWTDTGQEAEFIKKLPLKPDDLEKILYKNALDLLGA